MACAVHIPAELLSRLEDFPLRSRLAVRLRLMRLAEACVEQWSPEDPRWLHLAQPDMETEGWRFYTEGCCVRVRKEQDAEDDARLTVHALGRVVVHGAAMDPDPARIVAFRPSGRH